MSSSCVYDSSIDVASQTSAQWNLGKWAGYFKTSSEPDWNGKVYNIISLEITGTPLAKKVTPPRIVREIDWVDNYWHFDGGKKKANGSHAGKEDTMSKDGAIVEGGGEWVQEKVKPGAKWPKVQLYCLMGIRGSWTVSIAIDLAENRIGMSTSRRARCIIRYIPEPRSFTSSDRRSII